MLQNYSNMKYLKKGRLFTSKEIKLKSYIWLCGEKWYSCKRKVIRIYRRKNKNYKTKSLIGMKKKKKGI